ncbi:hypothetical protein [cf. Phormidesmis sp. LEGE 11477]|uniref:hypothetical protein n=1 Tax=cf. Phormidesmis sp. LEGE 11477 TaxID=1828680 RepID=UPI00188057D1|nr:hypothetical protein [cf. Phormidesmis sp. LEGE 11477]MBE9061045.1 hypothetical protein [cf. Phormidesmis sp. LEGE 11477]
MPITQSLLIVTALGFVSGFLITLQEVGLDYLVNKEWLGWGITLRKFAFSTLSLAVLFSIGGALITNWEPVRSLNIAPEGIVPFFFKTAIFLSIVTPISSQIRVALAQRQTTPEDSSQE